MSHVNNVQEDINVLTQRNHLNYVKRELFQNLDLQSAQNVQRDFIVHHLQQNQYVAHLEPILQIQRVMNVHQDIIAGIHQNYQLNVLQVSLVLEEL